MVASSLWLGRWGQAPADRPSPGFGPAGVHTSVLDLGNMPLTLFSWNRRCEAVGNRAMTAAPGVGRLGLLAPHGPGAGQASQGTFRASKLAPFVKAGRPLTVICFTGPAVEFPFTFTCEAVNAMWFRPHEHNPSLKAV